MLFKLCSLWFLLQHPRLMKLTNTVTCSMQRVYLTQLAPFQVWSATLSTCFLYVGLFESHDSWVREMLLIPAAQIEQVKLTETDSPQVSV